MSPTQYRAEFDMEWKCTECISGIVTLSSNRTLTPEPLTPPTSAIASPNSGMPLFPFEGTTLPHPGPSPVRVIYNSNTSMITADEKVKNFGKGLTFCHININGLKSKIDEVKYFLCSNHVAVLGITESKLSSDDDNKTFHVDSYTVFRCDRARRGGGSILYISKSIKFQVLPLPIKLPLELEITVLKIKYPGVKPIAFIVVYNPPTHSKPKFVECFRSVLDHIRSLDHECVIMGDFNINLLSPDSITLSLYLIKREFKLSQLMHDPTCSGSRLGSHYESLIDHVYVNSHANYQIHGHLPFAGSDHHMTFVTRRVKTYVNPCIKITYRPYAKADPDCLQSEISAIDFSFTTNNAVQTNAVEFSTRILDTLSTHVPLKSRFVRPSPPRWFTAEIAELCKHRDELRRISSKLKSSESWSAYKKSRNFVTFKIRQAKKRYFKSEFKSHCNSTSIWKNINQLTNYKSKDHTTIDVMINPESLLSTNKPDEIASLLADSFTVKPCPRTEDQKTTEMIKEYITRPHDAINPSYEFSSVSPCEVASAIKHSKNNGGPGVNFVPMRIFKMCLDQLKTPLASLFTTIFVLCNVPQCFKTGSVLPLYKGKGPHNDPNNYRPITILPPIVKIFERIIFMKLLPLVAPKFIPQQHGYRKSRSCQTALTLFTQHIFELIDGRNCRAGAVFVDLRKAFNSVDHVLLIKKMMTDFVLPPHFIRLMRSYLDSRVFKISLNGSHSAYFPDPCGVPQGSPLGNLLFTMFVNDITRAISLPFLLYADDLVFYTGDTDVAAIIERLEDNLNSLQSWCKANKLVINQTKTEYMIFHKPNDTKFGPVPPLTLDGFELNRVFKFRYLGIVIDPTLSFKFHFTGVCSRVVSAISKLHSVKRLVPKLVMRIMVNAYILPIYDYCINIWCVQSDRELEYLQTRIYRFLLSVELPSIDRKLTRGKPIDASQVQIKLFANQMLLEYDLLTIKERLTWTLIKNAASYLSSPIPELNTLFTLSSNTRTSRMMPLLVIHRHSSETFKRSTHYRTVDAWNRLPKDMTYNPATMNAFKKSISNHLINLRT